MNPSPHYLSRMALLFGGLWLLWAGAGCSSISPSTVQLSADVGASITDMERLHLETVQAYFDNERQKVEAFLVEEWEPLFLRNFLGTSGILDLLQDVSQFDTQEEDQMIKALRLYLPDSASAVAAVEDIVAKLNAERAGDPGIISVALSQAGLSNPELQNATVHLTSFLQTETPARLILDFAEAANVEIRKRRQTLLAPLDQQEREITSELSAAYARLAAGQSAITGRLEAASKVSQERQQLFQNLGVGDLTQRIQNELTGFSTRLDAALAVARDAEGGNLLGALDDLRVAMQPPPDAPPGGTSDDNSTNDQ